MEQFDKKWCSLVESGSSKYVIIELKIKILRLINQQQPKLFAIFFQDAHVSNRIKHSHFTRRVGGSFQQQKRFKETQNYMEAFPFPSHYRERERVTYQACK